MVVGEWCNDWFGIYEHASVIDPCGPAAGKYRVLRGGSAFSAAVDCRSAARSRCHFNGCYDRNGFRAWNPWLPEKKETHDEADETDDVADGKIKRREKKVYVIIPKKKELVAKDATMPKTGAGKPGKKKNSLFGGIRGGPIV